MQEMRSCHVQNRESPPTPAQRAPPALQLLVTGTQVFRRSDRASSLPGSSRQRSKASKPQRTEVSSETQRSEVSSETQRSEVSSETQCSEVSSEPQRAFESQSSRSRGASLEDDLFSLDLSQVSDPQDLWKTGRPRFAALATSTPKPSQKPKNSQNTPTFGLNTPKTSSTPDFSLDTPKTSQCTPNSGMNTPKTGQCRPKFGMNTPKTGQSSPKSGINTPKTGQCTPKSGMNTPETSQRLPTSGLNTPKPGQSTPKTGQSTPKSGINTPKCNQNTLTSSQKPKQRARSATLQSPKQKKMELSSRSQPSSMDFPFKQPMDFSSMLNLSDRKPSHSKQKSENISSKRQQSMDLATKSQLSMPSSSRSQLSMMDLPSSEPHTMDLSFSSQESNINQYFSCSRHIRFNISTDSSYSCDTELTSNESLSAPTEPSPRLSSCCGHVCDATCREERDNCFNGRHCAGFVLSAREAARLAACERTLASVLASVRLRAGVAGGSARGTQPL